MFGSVKQQVDRNLLKYAAGHHIFCPSGNKCGGKVLDHRDTVVATHKESGKTMVACGDCWDDAKSKVHAKHGAAAQSMLDKWDVVDGRPAHKRAPDPEMPGPTRGELQRAGQKRFQFRGEPIHVESEL